MKRVIKAINIYPIKVLLLALAYFLAGRFALLSAIPPGFASPVWPAAGIALAGILLGGYRYLPGILLGSFATNLMISMDAGGDITTAKPLMVAFTIAVGATFQAAVSAFFIKRVVKFPTPLEQEKDIGMILVLGGPVGCIVNATIGTLTLLFAGFISNKDYLLNWFTWWIGDTVGVILFVPFILILAASKISNVRKVTVSIPLMLLFLLVVSVFYYARDAEQQSIKDEFAKLAVHEVSRIQDNVLIFKKLLHSITQFYEASDAVDRSKFANFTKDFLAEQKEIQALGWIPYVPHNDKEKYELSARKDGYTNFYVTQHSDAGVMRVGKREKYYPVYYVEPYTNNQEFFGFDFGSNKTYLSALYDARDSGKQIAAISHLIDSVGNHKNILIFDPIYESGTSTDTIKERQQHLKGFVFGILDIGILVDRTLSDVANKTSYLHIYDNYIQGKEAALYNQKNTDALFFRDIALEVAGRQWTFEFTPNATFLQQNRGWQAWLTLIGGLLFASLFEAFLLITTARTDIAKRVAFTKSAELEISEGKHQAILDNTVDGIITIDEKGRVETFNFACEKTFGYQADEVIGQNVKMLMPEPYHNEHDGYLKNYHDTKKKKIIGIGREVEGRRKDGTVFPIDLSVSEVKLVNSKIYSGIIRDITERKKAQDEIEKAIEQLEASNTELERFAYIASHDLQEPLRMVVNFTNLLEKEYSSKLDEQAIEYLNFSSDAASRMQLLVSDLLEYSRVGQEAEKFVDVDCTQALDNARSNLAESLKQYNAEITNDALPIIKGNPIRMTRLFQNLIGNGIKYTEPGKEPKIHVGVQEKNSEWVFFIKDNGIGMKEEYLEKIFVAFKRLHSHSEYVGTGIGLAVCKKIVEKFGGVIWAESELGKGSTFYFIIPKNLHKGEHNASTK